MTGGPVAVDLVAAQSPSYRNRGIARHGLAFTEALLGRHAGLVGSVLLHPELPPVDGLDPVIAAAGGRARPWQEWAGDETVFHLTSAFEPEVPIRTLWPRRAARVGMKLAVTVYDLIPEIFPDMYLMDPGLRRRWRVGREVVRAADHVFTLSDSAAADVCRLLGVDESRVTVIGAGCDDRFHPAPPGEAGPRARAAIEGLGPRYIVYNGAVDPRKNMERLVEAFSALPDRLRSSHQLVLVCRAGPLDVNHYMVKAQGLGVGGRVVMPGFVADDVLVALYQSADLVVFPSLYEGYGLPVVEAMACGAPVMAADNSSLREIVAEEARFDASDVESMKAAMERGLTDRALRERLLAASAAPPPGWEAVADRAVGGYERLLGVARSTRGRPVWRSAPAVAFVAPSPWSGAPVSAGAAAVLAALRERAEVDVFEDGTATPVTAGRLIGADRARGGYDAVVLWLCDHPACAGAAGLVVDASDLPVPPVTVAAGLPVLGAFAAALGEEELRALAVSAYPGSDPADVASAGRMAASGYLLARPAISASARYLVDPGADDPVGALARLAVEAAPGTSGRVAVTALADAAGAAEAILAAALAVGVPGR